MYRTWDLFEKIHREILLRYQNNTVAIYEGTNKVKGTNEVKTGLINSKYLSKLKCNLIQKYILFRKRLIWHQSQTSSFMMGIRDKNESSIGNPF